MEFRRSFNLARATSVNVYLINVFVGDGGKSSVPVISFDVALLGESVARRASLDERASTMITGIQVSISLHYCRTNKKRHFIILMTETVVR